MEAGPGTAGRPASQADPAAVTGARTAPPPIRAGPQTRPRLDTRRLLRGARVTRRPLKRRDGPRLLPAPATHRPPKRRDTRPLPRARATHRPPKGQDSRPLPPARATRRPPKGRDSRPLPPARATRRLPGGRGPGVGLGGGDVNPPRAASPAAAPPSPRRHRPCPTAVRRHGRTRGGARNGGPARRSRERPATVLGRGIAASRVTVERRRLPDRGSQWARPGAGISARTRSTRPGVPAGPVLAVERACAPCGECGRAARTGGRIRPRDIRARVLPAGRERPVSRRYGHPDLGGTRRRPTGG